jgi:hypothetical protein
MHPRDWNFYICSQLHSMFFNVFLDVGVYCIGYKYFQRKKFIKLVAVIVSSLQKLNQFYIIETSVIYYWSGELILSAIQMWLPPQLYRCCSFGCRYTWGGQWSCSVVFGILRLKPTTTVVMGWTMVSSILVYFVYCLWRMCHVFFCKAILLY